MLKKKKKENKRNMARNTHPTEREDENKAKVLILSKAIEDF